VSTTPRVLIFDFDGTLADSMQTVFEVYNSLAPDMGLPLISAGEIPRLRELGPLRALDAYGVPLWRVPVLLQRVRRELERRAAVPAIFPGLDQVFEMPAIRTARRLILSSNSRSNIERFLNRHRLSSFERIDAGASLFGKARRLQRLLKISHLDPADVVYVGDELRDLEAAREVGATSVAVSWGYAERGVLQAHEPDFLVDDAWHLGKVLTQLLAPHREPGA
jgi:phosphoglycolate phosphatase-like HAD superfamily hydrolase